MTTYIAFLRGINVGAHNRVKMDALRDLRRSLGFEHVRTYIQSGNVAFETDDSAANELEDELVGFQPPGTTPRSSKLGTAKCTAVFERTSGKAAGSPMSGTFSVCLRRDARGTWSRGCTS